MNSEPNTTFLARARHEAARYGADAWVFVRELLQNSRDAGAHRVWFEVGVKDGRERISCRDDGEGMTFSHARQYLFTLYASSKPMGSRAAGRFGIGFWSILRFAPSVITIRSRSAGERGWQVRLDGDLEFLGRDTVEMERGTEVVIERPDRGDRVKNRVRSAILRDGPYLSRRGGDAEPLRVQVNGVPVRAELGLPPPSLRFRRRGLRGAVGLGPEPRVDVFAHGLRVRDATSLDELLLTGRRVRPVVSTVAGGLAPVALMDSSELTVLMARGDAREDRSLRRLVAIGHRELRRLVRAELDRHARRSLPSRLVERIREVWAISRTVRVVTVAGLIILGGLAGWRQVAGTRAPEEEERSVATDAPSPGVPAEAVRPYFDLGDRYLGPKADSLQSSSSAIDLEYRPSARYPLFAGLLVSGIDVDGTPLFPPSTDNFEIEPIPDEDDMIEVTLLVAAGTGSLRLPTPSGHVPEPGSLRFNGRRVSVSGSELGLAVVELGERSGGKLSYRCVRGRFTGVEGEGRWPRLPSEVAARAREISVMPRNVRAIEVVEYVRHRVVYDASPATAERHRREEGRGLDLFTRSLVVGAGDCDVQNAMVAAMLEAAGVRARLAVGWAGSSGRVAPGLHAWTEYLGADGWWWVVDASVGPAGGQDADVRKPVRSASGFAGRGVILGGTLVTVLLAAALVLVRNAGERTFNGGDRDNIAGLVRSAAARPEAFAGIHPVFTRSVLPTIGGRNISLARARRKSVRGRLAVGPRGCELAERAASRGTVLDGGTAEGAAAGEALGAVDLDDWQSLLSRSWTEPVAERVAGALAESGEPCRLRIAKSVGEEIAVLDGSKLGLGRRERWVVVDYSSAVWCTVRDLCEPRPAVAALLLADTVVDRLGLSRDLRDRHLACLARAALAEQVRVVS